MFAIGAVGPTVLERVGGRFGAKDGWGLELGYWALVVHKVADGIALGTYGGGHHAGHDHVAILVAIAAHTVPVVALVTLVYHRRGGLRSVLWRISVLAVATIVGVFIPSMVPATSFEASEPWITAAVAGLLMHVVAHDWQPEHGPPEGRTQRLTDIVALGLGLGLVLFGGGEHHHSEGAPGVREEMGHALLDLALSTAPALLIGLTIGALLSAFSQKLPSAWLRRGNAFSQALRGAVVGAPLPICACGVLPLAESLRRRGAGPALVVAFLLATPELGVETFALTARFMGWPFAFVRLGAAVALAMIAALVMHRLVRAPAAEDDHDHAHGHEHTEVPDERPFLQRFTAGFDELLYHIAPWTVVGLIGAAYVQAVMPGEAMGSMSGFGLDVLVITLVSVPSYVCAASATPLAAVLLAKGISPGAVLVGLLLGPATNIATIGFLRKMFGARATWIGIGVLVLAAWTMAGVVNVIEVPMTLAAAGAEGHEHGIGSLITGGVLALALFRSVWLSGLRPWLGSLSEGLGGHHHHHHHDHHHHGHHHHGHHHHDHGHHGHDHHDHDHDHHHDHHHHDEHEPAGG